MYNLTDSELISKYIKGSDECFNFLIKRYLPLIYNYVIQFTGNRDDVSDITQEVSVKIWKNIRKIKKDVNIKSWVLTIARNTAIDWLRKKNALPFSLLDEKNGNDSNGRDIGQTIVDETAYFLESLIDKQLYHRLSFEISKLPQNYNTVIKLRIENNLTFNEISSVLRKPLNTVKCQYRRGVIILKKLICTKL